ncbi:DUF429 domain-containing protein [Nocardiopsis sp. FR6]|uniref:DUF429 domain-containing protein n=1 Tax=Nocardiopsis sp. FR6 TaxID=2605986 RepID=UPI00351A1A1B
MRTTCTRCIPNCRSAPWPVRRCDRPNGPGTSRSTVARCSRRRGWVLPGDLGASGEVAADDVLDAAAAAWSAYRIAVDRARSCPTPVQTDASGRPIAIWY